LHKSNAFVPIKYPQSGISSLCPDTHKSIAVVALLSFILKGSFLEIQASAYDTLLTFNVTPLARPSGRRLQ
jgi:hypothetical protein